MNRPAPKILLFIPMYNCERQIVRVLDSLTPEIQRHFAEVIVIDNGSQDQGREAAQSALSRLQEVKGRLLLNRDNYSLGGSHKVAFNYLLDQGYDYCLVLHGDDQADIQDMVPHLESRAYEGYDGFLGARFHLKSRLDGYSRFKTLGNWGLNLLISATTRTWVADMGSGINLFSADFLKSRHYLYYPNNLTFNVFLLFYLIHQKAKIHFFPILWKEYDQVSNAKVFKQGVTILGLIRDYLIRRGELFNGQPNEWSRINYQYDELFCNRA